MIASKLPGIVNLSDAFTDEVLKTIKNTIKLKSGEFAPKYDGSKAFIRNDKSYLTDIEDEAKYWRETFNRRKKNLQNGFFSDKAKPYQTLGKVYLESGDLILSSLTDELKCKISDIPEKVPGDKWGKITRGKKTTPQKNKRAKDRTIEKLNTLEASAGFSAIKDRLKEVKLMKRGVYAAQSLGTYLIQREIEISNESNDKGDDTGSKSRVRNNWNKGAARAVGKLIAAADCGENPATSFAKAILKKGGKRRFLAASADYDDIEDEEIKLFRWKQERKKIYVQQKLQSINSILCTLYNMKSKSIKSQVPLQGKFVLELMRQDIILDQYGKPVSYRGVTITDDTVSVFSDGSNTPAPNTEGGERQPKTPTAPLNGIDRKRTSSIALGTPRKTRLGTLTVKSKTKSALGDPGSVKVETWEDLLNAGEKSRRVNTLKAGGYGGKYAKFNARKMGSPMTPGILSDITQPWCTIGLAEDAIEEKHKTMLPGSVIRKKADDALHDLRLNFVKAQKKISKDVEDELAKRRGVQFKLMQNKFNTITIGPITSVALDKMRSEAHMLTRDRKDNTTQPMPWFTNLQEQIKLEVLEETEAIRGVIQKIARFKYEDGKNIPLAKEKLCLLVMSMPAHILMNASMIHAILFVLVFFLRGAPELLDVWLSARKLTKIRRVETSSTPRPVKYN